MTTNIETAVHYRYVDPLLATGRIPNSREVAERLGVPIEEVQRALRSLADTHGVVLHTHVCEPWIIHPFSASPTATWVESGDRGWWATCMWWLQIATLVGATYHSHADRRGAETSTSMSKRAGARVRSVVRYAVPPRNAWDCVRILRDRLPSAVPRTSDLSRRHGIPMEPAPIAESWTGRSGTRATPTRTAKGTVRKPPRSSAESGWSANSGKFP